MPDERYIAMGQQPPGRSWAAGVLLLAGGDPDRDATVWQCEHRHANVEDAQACADEELRRRGQEGELK